MAYNSIELLKAEGVPLSGDSLRISGRRKILIVASFEGTCSCVLQGRQPGCDWQVIELLSPGAYDNSAIFEMDNYGWQDVRALAQEIMPEESVRVTMSFIE